jgi:hypothetical protein
MIPTLEQELKEARVTLEKEEYNLRWSGHINPYYYIRSAQYTVTRYWRNKVKELEEKLNDTNIRNNN